MESVCISEGKTINNTSFCKYKILPIGLTVTIIEHGGPIISGDILLKTLVDNNDGLPHTLEHMVFMGSTSYPKGFLDLAANRCLAKGTNAWTDQDHTVYSVSCAGKEGFLSFLPIFLDHILFPLLTEQVYTTEVHHITGEGIDAGVVYCEMQTYENTMDLITERSFTKELYGKNHVYSVETGGLLENLRTSCNIDKCRNFHKQFYTTDNTNIIIGGQVLINEVMNALEVVYRKILDHDGDEFHNNVFNNFHITDYYDVYRSKVTRFPSPNDDDPGMCLMGFLGPHLCNPISIIAEDILIDYLIATPISPLTKNLVHVDKPYCSSISTHRYLYYQTISQLKFSETDSTRHEHVYDAVVSILHNIVSESSLDLSRIHTIIHNRLSNITVSVENHDLKHFISIAYLDHLYGDNDGYNLLSNHLMIEEHYQMVLGFDGIFWHKLLAKLVDSLIVFVIAQPSCELLNTLEIEEEIRLAEQKKNIGQEELLKCRERIENAENFNNNSIDIKLFGNLSKPRIEKLSQYWNESTILKESIQNSRSLYLHNISSEYYHFCFIIDLSVLNESQKLYLPLMCELFCKLPVEFDDIYLNEHTVASKIEKLFISHDISMETLFYDQLTLNFVFRESDLLECLELLNFILYHQYTLPSRVKENLIHLRSNVKANKRCGYETIQSLVYENFFPKSVPAQAGINSQLQFLDRSIENVVCCCKNVETILNLINCSGCYLHVSSNERLLYNLDITQLVEQFNLKADSAFTKLRSYLDTTEIQDGRLVKSVPGEESSYLSAVLPVSTEPLDEIDLKMKVFQYWFGQLDGVVGREIRGKGLAYHFFVKNYPNYGILMMQLQQSSDIAAAYNSVKSIMSEIIKQGSSIIDEHQIDLAKSAVCYSLIEEVRSPLQKVYNEMKFIHGNNGGYGFVSNNFSSIINILNSIDCNSIFDLCKDYQSKLFDLDKSVLLITLPSSKAYDFHI